MRRGYSKALTVILIIIIVAVIALLAYLGYDYYSRYRTNKDGEAYVDSLTEGLIVDSPTVDVPATEVPIQENVNTTPSDNNNTTTTQTTQTTETSVSGSSSTKKRQMYKGFYTLGSIEIPKTNVKYPILEKNSKRALETAVAVIWPEKKELNTPGNIVIAGHNYRNGMFFSNNKKLSKGDKIYITDLNKKRIAYTIYKIFEASPNDARFYNRDTKGKREITLSTCTDDSSARLIIQARE